MATSRNVERILDKATDVLGSAEWAHDWIDKRCGTLGGIPRELATTDQGTRQVLLHLARLSHSSLS